MSLAAAVDGTLEGPYAAVTTIIQGLSPPLVKDHVSHAVDDLDKHHAAATLLLSYAGAGAQVAQSLWAAASMPAHMETEGLAALDAAAAASLCKMLLHRVKYASSSIAATGMAEPEDQPSTATAATWHAPANTCLTAAWVAHALRSLASHCAEAPLRSALDKLEGVSAGQACLDWDQTACHCSLSVLSSLCRGVPVCCWQT